MSMLERMRERIFYLPTRTQARIVGSLTVLVVAGAFVLDKVLTGVAHDVYMGVTCMLFGATVVLVLQQRRR